MPTVLLLTALWPCLQHSARGQEMAALPDAPLPQQAAAPPQAGQPQTQSGPLPTGPRPEAPDVQIPAVPPPPELALPGRDPCNTAESRATPQNQSCALPLPADAYKRFSNSGQAIGLTPPQKFRLAVHNVRDPFNLLTIGSLSAIDVASNPHGPYGPGVPGFAKESGTVLTETINGEFWGTFVIASLAHQDPHYHRMPTASIPRRMLHCITAVVVAQSDTGRPMFNIVEAGGYTVSSAINNLYVPYKSTTVSSTTARITTAMALDPIGNAITEFLPDLARKVNVKTVFIQSIINKVTAEETGVAMGPQ